MAQFFVIIGKDDTLSEIAKLFYGSGDETHWKIIYDANKGEIGPDPNKLTPGQTLLIPDLSSGEVNPWEPPDAA